VACRCDGRQRNGETESQNKEKKNKPRGHNALTDKVTPFGQSLRWRSQFTPQPACCFKRFYRIDKPDVPGVIPASIAIVLHFGHGGL
jgi:hypothetical protein